MELQPPYIVNTTGIKHLLKRHFCNLYPQFNIIASVFISLREMCLHTEIKESHFPPTQKSLFTVLGFIKTYTVDVARIKMKLWLFKIHKTCYKRSK